MRVWLLTTAQDSINVGAPKRRSASLDGDDSFIFI